MDHENGFSLTPTALYIDWSFSCGSWAAGISTPGDVLSLRTVAQGTFPLLPVATDLLFTQGRAAPPQLCFSVSLSLPTTPRGLSHDSWPARPPETPPLLSASRSEWSQTMEGSRLPPSKWRLCPWAFEGRIFLSWRCQNIMSGMANFLCHLKEVQQPISFLWSKLEDNYSLRDDMYIFKFESSFLNGPLLWVQANIWSCCSNGHRQDHNIALSPSSLSHLCSHFLRDVVHFSHKTN